MSGLLPCPFCGHDDQLYPAHHFPGTGPAYAIDCLRCGIDFTPREGMDVVAKWNTRTDASSQGDEEAKNYLRGLLVSFVQEHCDPMPEWAPLPDLMGMLTQIDNAITVTRDRQSEIVRLREILSKFMDYADAEYVPNTLFEHARAALTGSKE